MKLCWFSLTDPHPQASSSKSPDKGKDKRANDEDTGIAACSGEASGNKGNANGKGAKQGQYVGNWPGKQSAQLNWKRRYSKLEGEEGMPKEDAKGKGEGGEAMLRPMSSSMPSSLKDTCVHGCICKRDVRAVLPPLTDEQKEQYEVMIANVQRSNTDSCYFKHVEGSRLFARVHDTPELYALKWGFVHEVTGKPLRAGLRAEGFPLSRAEIWEMGGRCSTRGIFPDGYRVRDVDEDDAARGANKRARVIRRGHTPIHLWSDDEDDGRQ